MMMYLVLLYLAAGHGVDVLAEESPAAPGEEVAVVDIDDRDVCRGK